MKHIIIIATAVALASAAQASTLPPPPTLPPVLQPPPMVPGDLQTFNSGIPLAEFLKIALAMAGKRSYVLLPHEANSQLVSVNVARFKGDPVPLVREVLESMGYSMREVQGTLIIEKAKAAEKRAEKEPETEVHVYAPVHRTAGALSGYLSLVQGVKTGAAPATLRTPAAGNTETQTAVNAGATQYMQPDSDPPYVVFRATREAGAKALELLRQLDTPVPEVLIRAYVYEVRDSERKESSVQLVLNVLNGALTLQGGAAPTGDMARLTLPNISAAVSALAADSRIRLVSSPVLRAADGSTASAQIATDAPSLGAIVSQNGSTQQSVQYQSAGVLLSLTPRILDTSIRVNISQEISSFAQTTTGVQNAPTKLRRSFKSDVVARSGETLLLGGLAESSQSEVKSKGLLFTGGRSRESASSEFVVLLQIERL